MGHRQVDTIRQTDETVSFALCRCQADPDVRNVTDGSQPLPVS
jgi:hypothetical protein